MGSIFSTRSVAGVLAAGVGLAALSSCASELTRTGSSPAYVIVGMLEAASGAEPDTFGNPLLSDVQTLVDATVNGQTVKVPTRFNDLGRATMRIALKNPGTPTSPTSPSTLNEITLTRYHVAFRRSDGRNAPGVDVPHPFDGSLTVTIAAGSEVTAAFEFVRHQAKSESPLANLVGGGGSVIISTIAEVTFYGRDQVGNEVIATATMSVNFGDFADPQS